MRALLVLPLVGAVASAETLQMKRLESTNLHMAKQAGARHWTEDYTITVELGAKNKATVTSKGMRGNHDLTMWNQTAYNTEERAAWTTTWQGTWAKKGDLLTLVLVLDKHDCTGEKDDNGTKSPVPCKKASLEAEVTCRTETFDVFNAARTKAAKSPVWLCGPRTATELAESSGPWVFAKRGCLEVNGGKMTSNSYQRC